MPNWIHRDGLGYAAGDICPGPEWEPYEGPLPQTPLDELRAAKIAEIKQAHDDFAAGIAPEYGITSRDTWRVQEATARALLNGEIGEEQAAPLLLLVAGRSSTGGTTLTATEQAQRIVRNADDWSKLGLWTEGQRNGYVDQVEATAAMPDDEARAVLEGLVPVYSLPGQS